MKINLSELNYKCIFTGSVSLIKDEFSINSNDLTMTWHPVSSDTSSSSKYILDSLIAEGSVVMEQLYYLASANTIEILADKKIFILLGDAHFKDTNGSVWGERIEFDRTLKQTRVMGSGSGQRARIQFDIFGNEEENLEEENLEE